MRVLIDVANGRVSEDLVGQLQRAGHLVVRGVAQASARRFDVVVVGSAEAAEQVRHRHPAVAIVVFTRAGGPARRLTADPPDQPISPGSGRCPRRRPPRG